MANPTDATADAGTPSSAYLRMQPTWQKIDDIIAGAEAIRAAKTRYLPQHEAEKGGGTKGYRDVGYTGEYERRLAQAPWRPEFTDILQNLASKPFGKEVALVGTASEAMKRLAEDVDARGSNLTAFSRDVFGGGIAKGLHAILVDFPTMSKARTIADERAAGARPYWVSVKAADILALYTAFVGGKETVTHVRIRECTVERSGFDEVLVERVRVLEPNLWQLWRKEIDATTKKVTWVLESDGALTIGTVPLALFWTGEREGAHFVRPPLRDIADMQIELYRALSRQDEILTYTGSPMLCAQGLNPPKAGEKLEVGPKRVLFAPAGAEGKATGWSYIQPDADNLTEIRESVKQVTDDIRRLGMQPQTQKSGVVTAKQSGVEEDKAHSVCEAWALGLKDVLEQAFVFTAMWLGEDVATAPSVDVDTDFSVLPGNQPSLDALDKARRGGDLSRRTYWNGLRRFDVLSPDFDPDAEEGALAEEATTEPVAPIDPATGLPAVKTPPITASAT